jgi:thiol-disulfide isomerase/thioredoxin
VSGDAVRPPVVLTFFASWCTPCQTELPAIARIAAQETSAGGRIHFVGIDGNDDPSSGLAFARRSGVTFPAGSDPTEDVARALGLPGLPDTVFVDRSGHVVNVVEGPISEATLRTWIARLK